MWRLNYSYNLSFKDPDQFTDRYAEFFEKSKDLKLISINKVELSLLDMYEKDEYYEAIAYFWKHTWVNPINNLYLGGGYYMNFNKLSSLTDSLFPNILNEIDISYFTLSGDDLKRIIEGGRNCKSIKLFDCFFEQIIPNFKLDTKIPYKLEELDLSYSCEYSDEDSNDDKLVDVNWDLFNYIG